MSPPEVAALRAAVVVHEDRPGSLTSLLTRLERAWREGEQERERMLRLTRSELASYLEAPSDG